MNARHPHALAILLAMVALAGCGGGGSSSTAVIPTITAQPASQAVAVGSPVTFSVSATGDVPMTYQWYKNTVPIPDATKSTYVIAGAATGDAGTYRVAVLNAGGVTESNDAILTVSGTDGAPVITSQPSSQTVAAASAATFVVTATGPGTLTYQWYKGSGFITGATAATYTIASTAVSDEGTYHVTVTNSIGTTTSSDATLTVTAATVGAPVITAQPLSQTVTAGTPATFVVTATGTGTLAYQWFNGSGAIAGATSASYTIASTAVTDAGTYHATVTNDGGTTASSDATLTVNSVTTNPPVIISQPTSQTVTAGSPVTFVVNASGTGTLTYQWYKGAAAIPGATTSSYSILSTIVSDSGNFYVTVSDLAGSTQSATATLTVNDQTVSCDATYVGNVMTAIADYETALGPTLTAALQYDTAANTPAQLNVYKTGWSNLPQPTGYSRPGIALSQMTTRAQVQAFNALASTALSAQGYLDLEGVLAADDYLGYTRLASGYGAELYHVAVVGTPSASGLWTLMFGGHNMAFNLTFNGGCLYPTPHHMGAEPRTRFTSNNHYTLNSLALTSVYTSGRYTPLEEKSTAMLAIFSGMDDATLQSAFLAGQTFSDVLVGPVEGGTGSVANVQAQLATVAASSTRGALVSSLPAPIQALVTAAIDEFIGDYDAGTASRLRADYTGAYANTYVAWGNASGTFTPTGGAGAGDPGGPRVATSGTYMRIEGPRVWIEVAVPEAVVMPNQTSLQMIYRDKAFDYYNELAN